MSTTSPITSRTTPLPSLSTPTTAAGAVISRATPSSSQSAQVLIRADSQLSTTQLQTAVAAALRNGAQTVNINIFIAPNAQQVSQLNAEQMDINESSDNITVNNSNPPPENPIGEGCCSYLRFDRRIYYVCFTTALCLVGLYTCLKTIQLALFIFNADAFPWILSLPVSMMTLYIGLTKIGKYLIEQAIVFKDYTYTLYTHPESPATDPINEIRNSSLLSYILPYLSRASTSDNPISGA